MQVLVFLHFITCLEDSSFWIIFLSLTRLYPFYFGDSVFSENIVRLKSMVGAPLASDLSPLQYARTLLSGELGVVMLAVALLHYAGFVLG
jgi:hypothetical protein